MASIKLSLCAPDGLNLLDSPCRCLPAAGLLQDLQTPFPIEAAMFIVPQVLFRFLPANQYGASMRASFFQLQGPQSPS